MSKLFVRDAAGAGEAVNLLQNGAFTGGTYDYTEWGHAVPEVQLPIGWDLFSYEPKRGPGQYHRPETKVQDAQHEPTLTSPVWKAFTTSSTHRYALGQRVPVAVGTELRLWAYVYAWSSSEDPWGRSVGGSYRTRIGIDPFGGVEPNSPYIRWSHEEPGLKSMDHVQTHMVEALAEAGMITVWLQGDAEWAVKHNDAFWDGAKLVALNSPVGPGDPGMERRVMALEAQLANYGTVEAFGHRVVVETQ